MESWKTGKPFYKELKTLREDFKELEKRHPDIDWWSELAGSVAGFAGVAATPTGASALGIRGGTLAVRMLKGGATTAGISGADVAARGGDPEDVAVGAGIGAAGGAAGPVAGHVAGRLAARVRGRRTPLHREGAETEKIRQQADDLYNSVKGSNVVVRGSSFKELVKGLDEFAKGESFQRINQPQLNTALNAFRSAARGTGGRGKRANTKSLRR